MRRFSVRSRLVAAVAFVIALFAAPAADGHALVRETRPAVDQTVGVAPTEVVMRFNEPVDISLGSLRVYDTDGDRVDRGRPRRAGSRESVEAALRSDLPDGTYTVHWRVTSTDGHPIEEAFVFHVREPGQNPEGIASQLLDGGSGAGRARGLAAGLMRFVLFSSLLLVGGVVAFAAFVWRDVPALAWRAAGGAAVAAFVATVVLFVLHGMVVGDLSLWDALSGDVLGDVAGSRFGALALVRLGALALFVALLGTRNPWLLAVPVLVALATPGLAGHAGTMSPVALNAATDLVHSSAAAAWIGGLVVLLWAAFPALADDRDGLGAVVDRFSRMAMVGVALLVVTGVWRSYSEVRTVDAIDTAYGFVLIGKVVAFLPLLVLGYVNQRVVRPRLDAKAKKRPPASVVAALRRNVWIEVAVALVVVALTAVLVNLPPARTEVAGGPVLEKIDLGDKRLDVLVTPGDVGHNEVHLTLFDARGRAAGFVGAEVLFTHRDKGIGPIPAQARALAPSHWLVEGRHLSVSGEWELEVVIRTSRFEEERARLTVKI